MRKKNTILMLTSILVAALFLSTAIASAAVMKTSSKKATVVVKSSSGSTNAGVVKSTESTTVSSEKTVPIVNSKSESVNVNVVEIAEPKSSEVVSNEGCSLCASSESENLECDGGCKDCEQVISDAWNYAKQKADEATNIPDDFTGVPLIERIRIIRHEIRKYFVVFAANFAIDLNKESEKLPFDPAQAVAGALAIGITEFAALMLQYPLQPGLNLISAIQKMLDYVKALCSGEDPEIIYSNTVSLPSTNTGIVSTELTAVVTEQTATVKSSMASKIYISKVQGLSNKISIPTPNLSK